MDIYLIILIIIPFALIIIGPAIACIFRSLRGLFIHFLFICIFNALGSFCLYTSLELFNQHSFWAWIFLIISIDFYSGIPIILFFAIRDIKGTSPFVMEDLLSQDFSEKIILEKRNLFWPIILFPWFKHSHTVIFTGKRWLKDITSVMHGFQKIYLTNKRILAQMCLPKFLIIDILLSDIEEVKYFDENKDMLLITYKNSRMSPYTKLFFRRTPPVISNKLLLNLGEDSEIWMDKLIQK